MRFVSLIFTLILYRYFLIGKFFPRFNWFNQYYLWVEKQAQKWNFFHSWFAIMTIVIPIWLVVYIIYCFFAPAFAHLFGAILSLTLLLYCLDPENIWPQWNIANKQEETAISIHYSSTAHLLYSFFRAYFVIAFWFIVLGPLAMVFYRLSERCEVIAKFHGHTSLTNASERLNYIIEWIPAKLLTLGFTLMGHFIPSFELWLKDSKNLTKSHIEFIAEVAESASGLPSEHRISISPFSELNQAWTLFQRTFILFLVLIALVIVGRFM